MYFLILTLFNTVDIQYYLQRCCVFRLSPQANFNLSLVSRSLAHARAALLIPHVRTSNQWIVWVYRNCLEWARIAEGVSLWVHYRSNSVAISIKDSASCDQLYFLYRTDLIQHALAVYCVCLVSVLADAIPSYYELTFVIECETSVLRRIYDTRVSNLEWDWEGKKQP